MEGIAKFIRDDERCAIEGHDKMMRKVEEKDFRTYNLMMHIFEEENVHENKMMQFLGE